MRATRSMPGACAIAYYPASGSAGTKVIIFTHWGGPSSYVHRQRLDAYRLGQKVFANQPAMVPNFLAAGILAMIVGFLVMVWSVAFWGAKSPSGAAPLCSYAEFWN